MRRRDLVHRAAGMEHLAHAAFEQQLFLVVGHDAADDDDDVAEPGLAQRPHQLGHDQVVGGERRDADDVDVFLERQLDDRGNALPRRRVDHLHAGVAAGGGDDAAAAVVAVEADLGDENAGPEIGVAHAGSFILSATLAFIRPTKRRAMRSGVEAAAFAIPGLAPVQRAHQEQAQVAAVDAALERQCRHELRPARFVAVAQGDELALDGRRIARPDPDHDLRIVGLVEQRAQVRDAAASRRAQGAVERRHRGIDRGRDALDAFLVDGDEQGFLGLEVAVERAGQHADRADDLAHRCRREAALREGARRFVEQLRQAAVGAAAGGIHGPH